MKILRVLSVNYLGNLPFEYATTLLTTSAPKDIICLFRKHKFLSPNYFPDAMRALGYEVDEFLIDFPPFFQFWHPDNPSLALKQYIEENKPEVLYFEREAIFCVPGELKLSIKKLSSTRLITGYWGAQLSKHLDTSIFNGFDFLFSINETLSESLRKYISKVYTLRASFDGKEAVFQRFDTRSFDCVFLGSSGYGYEDHQKRFIFLRTLAKNSLVEFWCDEPPRNICIEWKYKTISSLSKLPKSTLRYMSKNRLLNKVTKKALCLKKKVPPYPVYYRYRPLKEEFPNLIHPPLFGLEYEQHIQKSRCILNYHVDNPKLYGNMRSYEATGLGSVLLTDRKEQMKNLFVIDEEIVAFSSTEEAIEKIEFLKKNPLFAEKIAQRGQKRTLRDHTIYNRANIIDQKIREHL